MKSWHLVSAAILFAVLLGSTHLTVRTDYGFVSTATGSRKTFTEWKIPTNLRTNDDYIESPIETFLAQKEITYADRWISYKGTGRSIFGTITYYEHGSPGPVLEIRPEFFPTIATMTDEEKMEIFECLVRGDEKEIGNLVLNIYEKFLE